MEENWLIRQRQSNARKIPDEIRKTILENKFIDIAKNVHDFGTPMEYLFDVYEEFIDVSGQHDDYTCHPCRQEVLDEWKLLKPILEELDRNANR